MFQRVGTASGLAAAARRGRADGYHADPHAAAVAERAAAADVPDVLLGPARDADDGAGELSPPPGPVAGRPVPAVQDPDQRAGGGSEWRAARSGRLGPHHADDRFGQLPGGLSAFRGGVLQVLPGAAG